MTHVISVLFGWPGTWGVGGNLAAWVLCGALAFGWLHAKEKARHVAQMAQQSRHHKEQMALSASQHDALRAQADRQHAQALERADAHHAAQMDLAAAQHQVLLAQAERHHEAVKAAIAEAIPPAAPVIAAVPDPPADPAPATRSRAKPRTAKAAM